MSRDNNANDYLEAVCSHIRWKRAHVVVRKELEAHIEDQREAFISKGMDEAAASGKAVEEMGDAAMVGSLLDRSYRPRPAWGVIAITAVLMLVGYLSRMYIISGYDTRYDHFTFDPATSLLWLAAAVAVLIAGYFLDFTALVKYPRAVRAAYYVPLTVMMFFAFISGSRYFGALDTHAHYLLMLFPVVYSGILCSMKNKGYGGFIACCAYLVVPVFFGLVIPRFVSAAICWFIGLFLLTFAIMKGFFRINKLFGLLTIYLPPLMLFIWLLSAGLRERLRIALHPELEPFGRGFVNFRAREILSHARMLGAGSYTYNGQFLPNGARDFSLTYLAHKLGLVSFIGIAALFVLLFAVLAVLILRQKSLLGRMVAMSVFLTLFTEFSVYIMNNLGFALVSSLTLPLVSYGNADLIINSFLIGLMLSVFRTGDLVVGTGPETSGAAHEESGDHAGDTLCCFQIKIAVSLRHITRKPPAALPAIFSRLRFPVISCRCHRDIKTGLILNGDIEEIQ